MILAYVIAISVLVICSAVTIDVMDQILAENAAKKKADTGKMLRESVRLKKTQIRKNQTGRHRLSTL